MLPEDAVEGFLASLNKTVSGLEVLVLSHTKTKQVFGLHISQLKLPAKVDKQKLQEVIKLLLHVTYVCSWSKIPLTCWSKSPFSNVSARSKKQSNDNLHACTVTVPL